MYYNKDATFPVPINETWDIQDGSKIKSYVECPRKYFYEYVLGWRSDRPSNHLIFGRSWHEALAHLYETSFSTDNVIAAYEEHFLPTYREYFDPGEDDLFHPKTPKRALTALAYYAALNRNEMSENEILVYDGKKLIEIGGTISISDEYTVAYRQDLIMRNNRGIFSKEHKTGSSTWLWEVQWELAPQTAVYTHVLYCLFNPDEVSGIKYSGTFFKKTKDDPVKDNKDPFRHFDTKIVPIFKNRRQMAGMIVDLIYKLDTIKMDFEALSESKDTDQHMSCFEKRAHSCNNWGRVCEYHDFCTNWNNPLKHIDSLPMGIKIEFWNPLEEPVKVEINV